MKKKDKLIFFIITGILMILICSCNAKNNKTEKPADDLNKRIAAILEQRALGGQNYLEKLDTYKIWDNTLATAIAQTEIAKIVEEHMDADAAGKIKKAIILGFDGARADVVAEMIKNRDSSDSGLNMLIEQGGGVYIAYCGGKDEETEQRTVTASGWASLLTGFWGNDHEVKYNGDLKNLTYKTVMLKYAENTAGSAKPLKTCFVAGWNSHFDDTYPLEIQYIEDNSNINMTYHNMDSDSDLQDHLLDFVIAGSKNEKDIIFGIYEDPDTNGHEYGFSNDVIQYTDSIKKSDSSSYEVIKNIYDRPTFANEDWLILMTTDHGGLNKDHGEQSGESRTTWIVSNKKIDEKYFSSKYDGFKCN